MAVGLPYRLAAVTGGGVDVCTNVAAVDGAVVDEVMLLLELLFVLPFPQAANDNNKTKKSVKLKTFSSYYLQSFCSSYFFRENNQCYRHHYAYNRNYKI